MTDPSCPTCREPMESAHFGPLPLGICTLCAGVWFSAGALPQMIQAGPGAVWKLRDHVRGILRGPSNTGTTTPGGAACPACRVALTVCLFPSMPGLRLHSCAFCSGFWLDAGSQYRLATRLAEAAPPEPPKPKPPRPQIGADGQRLPAQEPGAAAPSSAGVSKGKTDHPPTRGGPDDYVCPSCAQPNGPSAAVCWACGHLLTGIVTGTCPRCLGHFHRVDSDGVEVGACDGCGGIWLKDGRLSALLFQSEETLLELHRTLERVRTGRIKGLQRELYCMRCELYLMSKPLGMVTRSHILTCPQCSGNFIEHQVVPELLAGAR